MRGEMGKFPYCKCRRFFSLIMVLVLTMEIVGAFPRPDNGEPNANVGQIRIPAMAAKAGGRLKPELVKGATNAGKENPAEAGQTKNNYDYDAWSDDSSSEEKECSRNQYFHIRGKQCVPLRCRGGNKWRNQATGECEYSEPYSGYFSGYYSGGRGHARAYPSVSQVWSHRYTNGRVVGVPRMRG